MHTYVLFCRCDNYYTKCVYLCILIVMCGYLLQRLLERSDLNINAVDSWGLTAIHGAAQRGCLGPCEWLLARENIDLTIVDRHGTTAIQRARVNGHEQVEVRYI